MWGRKSAPEGGEESRASTAVNSMDGTRGHADRADGAHGLNLKNQDYSNTKIPRLTLRTVVMAVVVAMGGFIFGYDTGQISGFLEMPVFLERFGQQTAEGYKFSNVRSGLIVALLSIGTLIGALCAGPLADKVGRKWCIPTWCFIFMIGVTVQMAVGDGDWVGIVMGRWTAGLGVGGLSVVVPTYMAETSPVPVRGAVISCYQLFITVGILTADLINFGTHARLDTGSYRIPMGVGYIWPLLMTLGILFLPESPRHEWNHGHQSRALTTMSKFYGIPETHPALITETGEMERVRQSVQESDHSWHEVITGPRMFYRVSLAVALQMLQQLTGANYFFYYGTSIFNGVGIDDSYITAIILGAVNVGATIVGVWMARHLPRRQSLYIAALWQTMCFLVFASVGQFVFLHGDANTQKSAGTVMVVFACLFIVAFATTWGPLVWACIAELFPYRYRAEGIAMATASNWFWNFMLAFFTPFITGDINFAFGYVFAGCNLAAAFVVFFFLIESSGRSLEEIDTLYLLEVSPRKSGRFVLDEETKRNIGTDGMHLKGKGFGRRKAEESGEANFMQTEKVEDSESVGNGATAVPFDNSPPLMSAGGGSYYNENAASKV